VRIRQADHVRIGTPGDAGGGALDARAARPLPWTPTVPIDLLNPTISLIDPSRFRSAHIPALYVHIPFCAHKCHYCDFYSITGQTDGRMEHFVTLLLAEADLWIAGGTTITPQTVFFGGGTPTTAQWTARPFRLLVRERMDR
jgi:oxygen-independent coproporphyrinogen-3 oxidase